MRNCCAITFAAAGIQQWEAPGDVVLDGFTVVGYAGSYVTVAVSKNPTLAASSLTGGLVDNLIGVASAYYTAPVHTPLSYQAKQGELIYFSADSTAQVALYYSTQLI